MSLTAQQAVALVEKLYDKLIDRRRLASKLDKAYRGEHSLRFATEKWAEYHQKRYRDFSDNWCGVVGNSPAERLRVNGFRVDPTSGSERLDPDEQWLWQQWGGNELDSQSSQGLLGSIIAKRSSAIVWGDSDDNPVVTWESPEQVYVAYDPENPRKGVAALKVWDDDKLEKATLYVPSTPAGEGQVWKFQRLKTATDRAGMRVTDGGLIVVGTVVSARGAGGAGGWEQRQDPGDDVWPIWNPFDRLNVVEFPNRPMLGGEPISDIEGTLAMQDAINLLWAYLFNAADFASFPARVVMGQESPKMPILDENGVVVGEKEVPLKKLEADRILWLTGQDSKIGQWDAAKLSVFTDVIDVAVTHIAAQTRTPQHYLVGKMANLSADALKAAETGLVKKVEEQQLFYGPQFAKLFSLMAEAPGNRSGLAKACLTGSTIWKDAENRSEAQLVDGLTKLDAVGFPFEWLAERYGLSPTEIQRVLNMKQREQASALFGAMMSDPSGTAAPGQLPPGVLPNERVGGTPGAGVEPKALPVRI